MGGLQYESSPDSFTSLVTDLTIKYKVYVYDNSREGLSLDNKAIYYYHDAENGGLAKAINHCVDQALIDKVDRLVYFDQDSHLNVEFIDNLFASFAETLKKFSNLFVLGPQPVMIDGDFYPIKLEKELENNYFTATEIITSGMVFKPALVKELGDFDEDLFLDMIDFDICWRARAAGMVVMVDRSIKMVHEVGQGTIKTPFKILPISSPIRNYYQLRNILHLVMYKYSYSKIKIFYYLFRRTANIFINLIFADKKLLRLKYNYLGMRDAFKKNMGKAKF
jgi:rhamnosyltransferase